MNSFTSSSDTSPEVIYDIDVANAAEILGVGRTRVSQLTNSGVLSFKKRKIGTRNRLFYNHEELLAHLQNIQTIPTNATINTGVNTKPIEYVSVEPCSSFLETNLGKHMSTNKKASKPLPSAGDIKNQKNDKLLLLNIATEINNIKTKIEFMNNQYNNIAKILQQLLLKQEKNKASHVSFVKNKIPLEKVNNKENKVKTTQIVIKKSKLWAVKKNKKSSLHKINNKIKTRKKSKL